jgi:chromate transporter
MPDEPTASAPTTEVAPGAPAADLGGAAPASSSADVARIAPLELFVAFSEMALSGFGGVLPFAYRALVERRNWVSREEFARLLALGQVLPGPTICNIAVMFGYRSSGVSGAAAALAGMIALPITIVLSLGVAYKRFGDVPAVHRALVGMSAVAAGLILATAIKMARAVPRRLLPIVLSVLAFAGVGIARWPLIAVIAVLGPVAIFVAWKEGDVA